VVVGSQLRPAGPRELIGAASGKIPAVTKSSFLILHGLENHRPPDHWQFWLAARLVDHGHRVLYPGLPNPDHPNAEIWEQELHRQLAELNDGERIVVCHSLACLLWFRAAARLTDPDRVDRLLLVSPPASEQIPQAGASFRIAELNADAITASVRGDIRVACSDADPYNSAGAQRTYAPALNAEVDIISGGGHITPETGYGPWASAEAWCLDPAHRLRPNAER
jgi:predicted alpha/beta hydrolase family esterase